MSDNKNLRDGRDRAKVSGTEPYEVDYVARKLAPEFPGKSQQEIRQAVIESTKVERFHNVRAMIENSTRLKLRNR